jgi:hypothetical protein
MKLKTIMDGVYDAVSGKDGVYGAFTPSKNTTKSKMSNLKNKKDTISSLSKEALITLIRNQKRNTISLQNLKKFDMSDLLNHYYEII